MLQTYRQLVLNQYEAAFRTLALCIERCPEESWNSLVCNHPISRTVFHALFFADMYLGPNPEAVQEQPFHATHQAIFEGYEEFEDKNPEKTYTREFVNAYLDHCRKKARSLIEGISESELKEHSGFFWIKGTAAEVHVYNIRHIQHHAAQLSLRLRLDLEIDIPWVKSGWEN